MTRKVLLVATLVAVLGTSACSLFVSNNGGGGGGSGSRPGPVTDPFVPGSTSPKPSNPKAEGDTKGYADVAVNFSDKLDCAHLHGQVRVTGKEGRAAWTAKAKRTDSFADQTPADGVTIWPTSGTVDQGLSSTIQVEGTFDKAKKFFYVMVVSRGGSTGYSVKFTCQ